MDLPDLSARLTKVLEQRELRKKLERDLELVEKELLEKSSLSQTLETKLKKEKIDVEKLERTSLTSLFYSVLGSREQQLEKERQEALSAQLRYQQTKHQVNYLEQERAVLSQRVADLGGAEAEYKRLLIDKEQALRQSDPLRARELMQLSQETAQANSEIKEVEEAIWAGNGLLTSLEGVIESLESAERWGVWDILGGDLLSTAVKHSRIDDARTEIDKVQADMSRFKRELADVQQAFDLRIDIGGFDTFADFFFDGLIVDWVVQSKIEDSLGQALQAKKLMDDTLKKLQALRQKAGSKLKDLQEQHDQLIARS